MQKWILNNSKPPAGLVNAGRISLALLIAGCLQGPWEYTPEKLPLHRGLWVTGYMIADRPVRDFCIERLLALDEESTNAYRFYDSAEVTISGVFSGGSRSMKLSPHPEHVNCFVGDSALLPERGETYTLSGWVAWDSSGAPVKTEISAVAKIPTSFSIRDTALAPALAATGMGMDTTDTATGLSSFLATLASLEEGPRDAFFREYASALDSLQGESDSAAILYFIGEMDNIIKIFNQFTIEYQDGDSLFFLTGLEFFLVSHYFTAYKSDDIGGVLITHRYDSAMYAYSDGLPPIFGVGEPGVDDYYEPGSRRRLILYSEYQRDDGYDVLDSMGFVQAWFLGGWNTIYFYGVGEAYADYVETAVSSETDSRISSVYNVEGAKGVFTGAILDSFRVYIKSDGSTDVYTKQETKIAYCNRGGSRSKIAWEKSRECRDYYPQYCEAVRWKREDCLEDFFATTTELGLKPEAFLDSLKGIDTTAARALFSNPDSAQVLLSAGPFDPQPSLYFGRLKRHIDTLLELDDLSPEEKFSKAELPDSLGFDAKAFERAKPRGEYRFCTQHNYPDSVEACKAVRDSCTGVRGENDCKKYLWQYCKDRKWQPLQCGPGLVGYCRDRETKSELLCANADLYCERNREEFLCKE